MAEQNLAIMMETHVIDVSRDFSASPGGRFAKHGPSSGEEFRRSVLKNAIAEAIARDDLVIVRLDGTAGYGGSFLEEAFGGLVREEGFSHSDLKRVLRIEAHSPVYEPFREMAKRFIENAQPSLVEHA